jgi:hypothetical protein
MKKLIMTCLILALALMLMAEPIALLSANKGKVSLERNKKDIEFKNGELLNSADVLRTGAESFAAYKFIDASALIKLFSNSVVTINAEKDGKKLSKRVVVSKGSMLSSVKSGTGVFAVQTPTTVASVKGTEFMTRVDDRGNSMFIVTEGEVEVRVMTTDERVIVSEGKTATVDSEGEIMLRDTSSDDLSALEQIELESTQSSEKKTIRIPVLDEAGNTKYIEITY